MKNNNQNMFLPKLNRTGGVMDSVFVLGAVVSKLIYFPSLIMPNCLITFRKILN
jgi:hypothetical protein